MKKNSFFTSLPFKLLVGVVLGIIAGLILSSTDSYSVTMAILNVVVTSKYILGQLISFCSADHHWIYRTIYHQTRKQCFPNAWCCSRYCLCFLHGSCSIL